ncbi:MAG: Fe-S cluster assembly protein SufD [Micavibrio sp.]|nr:Fe-S cluster assembly protein SufD [Micavibrio sp.]|tara:strand:+ start:218442 stop:219599 length:1158 start_codon:yes stop_codon:yes gene_type:complete
MSAHAHKEALNLAQIDEDLFGNVAFPSAKAEGWQYTPLAKRMKKHAPTHRAGSVLYNDEFARYYRQLLPEDTEFSKVISDFKYNQKLFNNSNIINIPNLDYKVIFVCDIPENTRDDEGFILDYSVAENAYFQPLIILNVGKGARLRLLESADISSKGWLNRNLCLNIEAGAEVHHTINGEQAESATYTQSTFVWLAERASYSLNSLAGDGRDSFARHNLHAALNGEEASFDAKAVFMSNGQTLTDLTTQVLHNAPNCQSEQTVRCIVSDKARAVAQGKVYVDKDAQKTISNQQYKSLILSELSDIFTKPELEIYADDVECAHGATTGQLDDNALFYLRSRGISRSQAKKMLTEAFLRDIIDDFADGSFKEDAESWLETRLNEVFS